MTPDDLTPATIFQAARLTMRRCLLLLCGAAVFLLAYRLRSVLNPLFLALLAAYVLDPAATWLQRFHLSRLAATSLICTAAIVAVIVAVPLVSYGIYSELRTLLTAFTEEQGYNTRLQEWAKRNAEKWNRSVSEPHRINEKNLRKLLADFLESSREQIRSTLSTGLDITKTLAQTVSKGITGLTWSLLIALLFPIYTFFFLLNLHEMGNAVVAYIPREHKRRGMEVLWRIHDSMSGFFRGKLIICLIRGILASIAFLACGVKFGVVVGFMLYGVLGFIPVVGSLAAFASAELILYVDAGSSAWGPMLAVAILILALEGMEMGLLGPLILGRHASVHPVVIIVAMLAGGDLFGLFGVILAVPVAAVIKILGEEFILKRLKRRSLPEDNTHAHEAGL